LSITPSMKAIETLSQVDPNFVTLCQTLFGDTVEPEQVWDYLYSPDGISKAMPDFSSVHTFSPQKRIGNPSAGWAASSMPVGKKSRGRLRPVSKSAVSKSDDDIDVVWTGEFVKMDTDKRQVFGWASVVEVNGQPVIDRQGDWITPDEIEKAAYEYVVKSRKGGDQHQRQGDVPFHASDLIESFVVTPEKIEKMGLPEDTPVGWWVGFKVNNEDTWQKVKKGTATGFSIHGKGKRREIPMDEAMNYA